MKPTKKVKIQDIQASRDEQDDDYDDSLMYNECVLDKEDLVIWPIDQVCKNFKAFLAETSDLAYSNLQILNEFTIDTDIPKDRDLEKIFDFSLQKVQGRQNKKKWKDNEKSLLQWVILRYCMFNNRLPGDLSNEDWRNVAKLIIGRNATQCKYKWLSKSKYKLVQVPWTKEEDDALVQIYNEYRRQGKQNKWSDMAKEIALRCETTIVRQGKQCRERWINKLDPSISRGPWSKEEELKILKLILLKGKKWSEISKILLNQRTENALKNRYHTLMKKEKNKVSNQNLDTNDDVSELIKSLQLKNKLTNPIHLYEDIDPQELQIIVKMISRLEEETGLYDFDIKDEFHAPAKEEAADMQNSIGINKSKAIQRKFLEEFHQAQLQMEKQEENKEKNGVTHTVLDEKILMVIKAMLSKKNQEADIDYKKLDEEFNQFVKSQGKDCEFELEQIDKLKVDDIEDLQFTLVDQESNTAYLVPTQYIWAVVERLKGLQQKQAPSVSKTEQQQQPPPQQQQQSQQVPNNHLFSKQLPDMSQQFIFPAQSINAACHLMYPQLLYQPLANPLQYSQLAQSYIPNVMVVSNQYYPLFMAGQQDQMDFEVKQENNVQPQINYQQYNNVPYPYEKKDN